MSFGQVSCLSVFHGAAVITFFFCPDTVTRLFEPLHSFFQTQSSSKSAFVLLLHHFFQNSPLDFVFLYLPPTMLSSLGKGSCCVKCSFSIFKLAYSLQLFCVNILSSCHLTCASVRIQCFVFELSWELDSQRDFSITAKYCESSTEIAKCQQPSLNIHNTFLPYSTNGRACRSTTC